MGALKLNAGEKTKGFSEALSGSDLPCIKMQCNTGRNSVRPSSSIFENLTQIFIVLLYITPVYPQTWNDFLVITQVSGPHDL